MDDQELAEFERDFAAGFLWLHIFFVFLCSIMALHFMAGGQ